MVDLGIVEELLNVVGSARKEERAHGASVLQLACHLASEA